MGVEKFNYGNLLHPEPVTSLDHFSFRVIPGELRTAEYDLRLLNGGANKPQPYSPEEHVKTDRWKYAQTIQRLILSKETASRLAIHEAALRNYGGGNPETDKEVQQRAVRHIARLATGGANVGIVPYSADIRGTSEVAMIAGFDNSAPIAATYDLWGGRMSDDPSRVERASINFDDIWGQSLRGSEGIDRLYEIAAELPEMR